MSWWWESSVSWQVTIPEVYGGGMGEKRGGARLEIGVSGMFTHWTNIDLGQDQASLCNSGKEKKIIQLLLGQSKLEESRSSHSVPLRQRIETKIERRKLGSKKGGGRTAAWRSALVRPACSGDGEGGIGEKSVWKETPLGNEMLVGDSFWVLAPKC
jgi:hypothetical protein